jgi:hypothetical protein
VLCGRAAHQLQRRADLAVGKNVEKGRLLEFDGQSLLESTVEDRSPVELAKSVRTTGSFPVGGAAFVVEVAGRERK